MSQRTTTAMILDPGIEQMICSFERLDVETHRVHTGFVIAPYFRVPGRYVQKLGTNLHRRDDVYVHAVSVLELDLYSAELFVIDDSHLLDRAPTSFL
jgi:hypothetical protein